MKGSSIATVILVAIVATVVAAVTVNAVLGDPNEESVDVIYMDEVSANIDAPDQEVFNDKAVNPTVEVYVGECRAGEVWDEEKQTCVVESTNEGGDGTETDETGE